MRLKTDPLPSHEETKTETEKRLKLIGKVKPYFEKFCDIMIVTGSMSMGKYYSVRKSSDIDIILLMDRKSSEKIRECSLIHITPKYDEAIKYFESGQVDHFSVNTEKMEDVEMQYHFWDTEAHFKMIEDENFIPKVYNVWRTKGEPTAGNPDLQGVQRETKIPLIKKCEHGVINIYPPYLYIDGKFVIKQPMLNFIAASDVIFCKDKRLYKIIDKTWDIIAKKFIEEKAVFDKEDPIRFLPGNWSYDNESKKEVLEKFKQALINNGFNKSLL